ncbi:MAG TPA: hypothetical protein VIH99_12635, partial [Bdellovibrionota bacterium]
MPILISLLILFSPSASFAGNLLSPSGVYSVKPDLKEPGVAVKKALENIYSEMSMDFQSFDTNDSSGKPMMSTHTDQRIKLKKLPSEGKAPKEGAEQRTELTFERLNSTTEVAVPG